MITYFILATVLWLTLTVLKNYILYFHKESDIVQIKPTKRKGHPKHVLVKQKRLLHPFFSFVFKNQGLVPSLIIPHSRPDWVMGGRWSKYLVPFLVGINTFLLPFACIALIFSGLQLWVDSIPIAESFETIAEMEKTRGKLVSFKNQIHFPYLSSNVSIIILFLLFITLSCLPALREYKVFRWPLHLMKLVSSCYFVLVLSTSFTFFANTVAEGSCTEKINKLEARITSSKERAYTLFKEIVDIANKEAAIKAVKDEKSKEYLDKVNDFQVEIKKHDEEYRKIKAELEAINRERQSRDEESNEEYPLIAIPVNINIDDLSARYANDFVTEVAIKGIPDRIDGHFKNSAPPDNTPGGGTPSTDPSDSPKPGSSPDDKSGPLPKNERPRPKPSKPEPLYDEKKVVEDLVVLDDISEEKLEKAVELKTKKRKAVQTDYNALSPKERMAVDAMVSVTECVQRYGLSEVVMELTNEVMGDIPFAAPFIRQVVKHVIPQYALDNAKGMFASILKIAGIKPKQEPVQTQAVEDILKKMNFKEEVNELVAKTEIVRRESPPLVQKTASAFQKAQNEELIWKLNQQKRQERIAEAERVKNEKQKILDQNKLDESRGWSENESKKYNIICSCYCGGRLKWTRWVSSSAICISLCPTGVPCR